MADYAQLNPPLPLAAPRIVDGPDAPDARAALEQTWRDPPGWIGMLSAINHKTIARRFIITTFAFFVLAGLLALAMRTQLAFPGNRLVSADLYDRLFTMHGTTMMFLFAVPVMQAVAGYLIPLMIGARSVAFPRMNAYAYWMFLFGGLTLYAGFAFGAAPASGWFSYVPLAGPDYATGKGSDIWAQMITFTELSALLEAIVLITTILKMRAPGMSLNRLPLFAWATLVTQFMVLFAMPSIMLGSTALILDRLVGTQFYNPSLGGDVLLWQHLFWFFGHPEVYLIFIPALGFLSAIIATFARRSIFGYPAMVLALVATAFLAFGLWVHHMFATSVPALGKSFFTAASVMIAIPSGIQIFCWIATLATGRLNLKTPLLFVLAFFVILVAGGMTGVMLGSASLDLQLHDTYFVVAHLHYVLLGGAVFPLFGAFFYWFPKMTGKLLNETLGRWQFWLFFVGFNVTFFPMHLLGLDGMPRRMWTYPAGMGWSGMNLLSTIGAWTIGVSVLLFIVNVWRAWRHGAPAAPNPWGGGTLEWSVDAPPRAHNFDVLPVVRGRDPLWEAAPPDARIDCVSGLAADAREVLLTTALDARPDLRMLFPSPSLWPLIAALATTLLFIGSIFTPTAVIWGSVPVAIALIAWFWPRRDDHATALALELPPWDARAIDGGEVRRTAASRATIDVRALPTFGFGARSPMWWATCGLMLIEGTVFAIAIAAYFYLRSVNATWPLNALPPDWRWGTLNTAVLLVSLAPNEAARRAANRGDRAGARVWLIASLAFALVFLIVRGLEFGALNVSWYANAYGSIVWLLLGLHTTHLITDTVDTAVLAVLLFTGPFEGRRFVDTSENAVYRYFVVLSWLPIYAVLYLTPRL